MSPLPRPSRVPPDQVAERSSAQTAGQQSIQKLALWAIALFILGSGGLLYARQRGWLPNLRTAQSGAGTPGPTPPFLPNSPSAAPRSGGAIAPLPSPTLPSTAFQQGRSLGGNTSLGTDVLSQRSPDAVGLPGVLIPTTQVLVPSPGQPALLNSIPQGNSLLTVNPPFSGSSASNLPPHPLATALHRLAEFPAAELPSSIPGSSSRIPAFGAPAGSAPPTQQMSPPIGSTGYIVPQEVRSPAAINQPDIPSTEEVIDPFADLEPSSSRGAIPEPPPFSVPGRTLGNGEIGTFSNPGVQPD